jgi:Bacterial membrane protein YfhO
VESEPTIGKTKRGLLLIGAAVLILYAPFWLFGRVFVPQDFLNFVYPWKPLASSTQVRNPDLLDIPTLFFPIESFVNKSLKSGDIPLWNPQIFLGHPIFASGQSGLFYPPKLVLHALFSPEVARTLSMLGHTAAAAGLMFYFLQLKGLRLRPCFLGATVWVLNGQTVGWAEYDHIMLMATNLPLMLIGFEQGRRGRLWGWPLLAVAGALCLHSGHLQLAFYAGLVLLAYAVFSLASNFRASHSLAFVTSGVLVVLLAAPTLLPFAELLRNSARQDFDFSEIKKMASSLGPLLVTLIHPDLLGNPTSGFMLNRVPTNLIYAEFSDYFGAFPLLLVTGVGWRRRRLLTRGELWFWQSFAALMLLFACASPLYQVFTLLMTPLAKAVPGRSLLAFGFATAYLSSHALDGWLDAEKEDSVFSGLAKLYLLLGVIVWCFSLVLLSRYPQAVMDWLQPYLAPEHLKLPPFVPDLPQYQDLVFIGLWQNYVVNWQLFVVLSGLAVFLLMGQRWSREKRASWIVLVTFLELAVFFWTYTPTVSREQVLPTTPAIKALQQKRGLFRIEKYSCGFYDLLTPYGLDIVTGYDSVVQKPVVDALRWTDPEKVVNMRTIGLRDFTHPFFRHAGLKYLMVGPRVPTMPSNWIKIFDQEVSIYENPDVIDRVYLASRVEVKHGAGQVLDRMAEADFAHGQTVILGKNIELGGGESSGSARVVVYSPDVVRVQVEANQASVLVLNDAIYDGWEAAVDGQPAELLRANGVFRGVFVTAGHHTVTFAFRPKSLRRGLQMAALGLALSLLWLVLGLARKPSPGVAIMPLDGDIG